MKPINFPEANKVYGIAQPEYQPLHAYRAQDGAVTSCWKLSWKEKWRILFTGRIYVTLLTFNQPIQPQLLSTEFKLE